MEKETKTIINIEFLSIIIVSIGVFGYWYYRDTTVWFRILFAELFGAGILTALLPLAIYFEGNIIRNRFRHLEVIIKKFKPNALSKKFKIADIISPKKTITFTFIKISDREAKKRIIDYLRKQVKRGKNTTDIFKISSALKIPSRQVNRILFRQKA